MSEVDMARLVKPLRFDCVWFVVHASGSIEFFRDENSAMDAAYKLCRFSYLLDDEAFAKHGNRLLTAKAEWEAEEQADHAARILAALDAELLAELVGALTECHEALRDHGAAYPNMVKGYTLDAECSARALLAKLKGPTP